MGTMEAAGDIHIIAATALLVRDADKLTYRQQLWIYTPPGPRRGFKAATGEIPAEALAARKPDIACHPGSSPMRTPAHNHTLGGEKDLDTSPDGLPEVPSTKCNCARNNPGLQSKPADEDREKAAHWNQAPRGRARATLGDRFH